MRDETPSSPDSLRPSKGLAQILSSRSGPGSQTQAQQFAGGNASAAGDQTWGTPRDWHGTHFRDSLQKPLPEHVDLHAETQQMHRDHHRPQFWPNS